MTSISLSDMAQNFALRRQNTSLQADVRKHSTESTTGLVADRGRALGGDFTALSGIDSSLARLNAYGSTLTQAETVASATQSALDTINVSAGSLGIQMLDPTTSGNTTSLAALAEIAASSFEATVAALNSQVAGQLLFAGVANVQPLPDASAILSALQEATAGATTAQEVSDRVAAWFASDQAYQGGADRAPSAVGDHDRVDATVTAGDPALMRTVQALAMGALLSQGALEGQDDERRALARITGTALTEADAARTELSARLGASQEHLADIRTRDTAQISALKMARLDILAVDPYESAVRLEATQTQIETLYSVTARLSRMSLADFL
ncbi:flagellin [Falsirhodobacter deserti]|uniref:flagellin n=1 Tax=Falsirhodobacter deserti TaxID=1365611 RepID=UPI000FE2E10C|nr:flagellin [Falsirhodobacter deserti]